MHQAMGKKNNCLQESIPDAVVRIIAEEYATTPGDVLSSTRQQPAATARVLAYAVMHQYAGMRKIEIARYFRRSHCAVLQGISAAQAWMLHDRTVIAHMRNIRERIADGILQRKPEI